MTIANRIVTRSLVEDFLFIDGNARVSQELISLLGSPADAEALATTVTRVVRVVAQRADEQLGEAGDAGGGRHGHGRKAIRARASGPKWLPGPDRRP